MVHVVDSLLLIGALLLFIGMSYATRNFLQNRREEAAPFRNYFSTEYDYELLRHSELSEDEDWLADRQPRSAAFRHRDSGDRE